MTNGENIVRVNGLSLWIGAGDDAVQILHDVSFAVASGQRWGIAGESGAGKSMLMHALAALLPIGNTRTSGEILYRMPDGSYRDLLSLPQRKRRILASGNIAFVFQDSIHALNPYERVGRQWDDTVRLHRPNLDASRRKAHLLEQMDVFAIRGGEATLRSFPHQLSGGMRQRIAIAMALESQNAENDGAGANGAGNGLIIADEPTTSLDSVSQRAAVDYIQRVCDDTGKTLLYVSHNLGILQHLCSHIMVMKDGRIVEQGAADDVFSNAQHPYTRKIIAETRAIMGKGPGGSQ